MAGKAWQGSFWQGLAGLGEAGAARQAGRRGKTRFPPGTAFDQKFKRTPEMIYRFKENSSFGVDAQAAGRELERIKDQNYGDLSAPLVVDEARPEDAVLHPAFEWDNFVAAEKHREDQARRLIRSVRIVEQSESDDDRDEPETTIAYVSVGSPTEGGSRYVTTARALSDEDMRERVLHDAIKGLRAWRARYGQLSELAAIIKVIDSIEEPMLCVGNR
jgi:hypothetical protein